jgi:hypothetical protein
MRHPVGLLLPRRCCVCYKCGARHPLFSLVAAKQAILIVALLRRSLCVFKAPASSARRVVLRAAVCVDRRPNSPTQPSGAHGAEAPSPRRADCSEGGRAPEGGHHPVIAAPVEGRRVASVAAEGAELAERAARGVSASRVAGSGAAAQRQRRALARGRARPARSKQRRRQASARRCARGHARRRPRERHARRPRHTRRRGGLGHGGRARVGAHRRLDVSAAGRLQRTRP